MQGRIFSLTSTISMLLIPLGTIVFGFLFDHLSALPIFAITGILLIIFTTSVVLTLSRQKLLNQPKNSSQPQLPQGISD